MHLLGFTIFASLIVISITEFLKCSDITTRRAIEKRGREINLKCLENKEQLEKCNNHTATDIAWKDFEQINEDYFTALDSCKEEKREKRHCGCTDRSLRQQYNDLDHIHDHATKKFKRNIDENRLKRNVHGTSDDKNDQEVEHDYSKTFRRFKRNKCLKSSGREKSRLVEKFGRLCKPSDIYSREKMNKSCRENLAKLSKARQRAYGSYVTSFRRCFGPIS